MSRFTVPSLLMFALLVDFCQAQTIEITSFKSGTMGANVVLEVKGKITGTATKYIWRLEAKEAGKTAIPLEGGATITMVGGVAYPKYSSNAAPVKAGTKYTFTLKLFKAGADPDKDTPLDSDDKEYIVANEPWPKDPGEAEPVALLISKPVHDTSSSGRSRRGCLIH